MNKELHDQYKKDCESLEGNMADALFVAWGKGYLYGKKAKQTSRKKEYMSVVCVTGGDGYEEGKIYPLMGWNNGVHILRVNEYGDVEDREFQTGGVGKGLFNDFDSKGFPSFDEIPSEGGV